MITYRVEGMARTGCEAAIRDAVRAAIGHDIAVEVDRDCGEVRVSASADPQVVVFAIEGAGYAVKDVKR